MKTRFNNNKKILRWLRVVPGITWILFGILIVFFFVVPHFGTADNTFNLIRQGSVLIIVAIGMMIAITSGGIDLSVGSLIGLAGTVIGYMTSRGLGWPLSVIIGILICSIAGFISGLIIAKGHIFPFVVTFGMLFMARSISLGLTQGGSIHIENEAFSFINEGFFLFMPIPFWITLVLIFIVAFLMKRTVFGRYIFSIGNDATSASWMGINIDLYCIVTYIISGMMAGIAGTLLASRVNTGNALIGQGTEFLAIAAVVIGGTPITGGRCSLSGTIMGALMITVLQNGLTLLGLSSEKVSAIVGMTLILGVILAQSLYQGGLHGNK